MLLIAKRLDKLKAVILLKNKRAFCAFFRCGGTSSDCVLLTGCGKSLSASLTFARVADDLAKERETIEGGHPGVACNILS